MSGPRCRRLRSARGADRAGGRGAGGHLVVAGLNVKIARFVAEYLLPLLTCPCCGNVNAARGRAVVPRAPVLRAGDQTPRRCCCLPTATCRLTAGEPDRHARVRRLRGPGHRAAVRSAPRRQFDDAMQAALEEEPVLAADETPVNLLDPHAGLAKRNGRAVRAGGPHSASWANLAAAAWLLAGQPVSAISARGKCPAELPKPGQT